MFNEFSPKAVFRLTFLAPLALAGVLYAVVLNTAYGANALVGASAGSVKMLAMLSTIAVALYICAMSYLAFGSTFKYAGKYQAASRVLTVAMPLMIALLAALVDAIPGRAAGDAPVLAFAAGMTLLPVAIFFVAAIAILAAGEFLLVQPVRWVLGSPVTPQEAAYAAKQEAVVHQSGSATQQPVQQSARGQTYEFDWREPKTGLDGLAGMAEFKAELNAAIAPFRGYAAQNTPVSDRNGILLSGPPGNGKTTIAQMIAADLGLPFVKVGGQDLTSKWVNESAAVVKELFRQASERPCVVFFDEFDGVAMNRGSSNMNGEDRKVVNALLSEIDSARSKRIVLIAATNYAEQIDSAIARDGRFDHRIEVPYPDEIARKAILTDMLKKFNVGAEEATVAKVAHLWHRRSVAFIEATVKRLRDNGKGIKGGIATVDDFKLASREASRRASAIPSAGAKLSEIALPADVRRETDSLVYRLRNWEDIAERGGEPPTGVLLYGPPGTGKTNLARALARELEYWHVFEVNATHVLQDPTKFTAIVELAATHRPAIVFIDEADELLRDRNHSNAAGATNEILKTMDGFLGKVPEVVFIAATNNPEVIDGAALRGGRFAEKIWMGKLTGDDLVDFLRKDFASKPKVAFADDLTPETMAAKLVEAAPADALGILRKAINYTFEKEGGNRPVNMEDIGRAVGAMQL